MHRARSYGRSATGFARTVGRNHAAMGAQQIKARAKVPCRGFVLGISSFAGKAHRAVSRLSDGFKRLTARNKLGGKAVGHFGSRLREIALGALIFNGISKALRGFVTRNEQCAHEIRRIYICPFQPSREPPWMLLRAFVVSALHSSPDRYCKCRSNRAVVHRQAIRFFSGKSIAKPGNPPQRPWAKVAAGTNAAKSAGRFRHHQHAGYQFRVLVVAAHHHQTLLRGKQSVPRQPDGCHQEAAVGREPVQCLRTSPTVLLPAADAYVTGAETGRDAAERDIVWIQLLYHVRLERAWGRLAGFVNLPEPDGRRTSLAHFLAQNSQLRYERSEHSSPTLIGQCWAHRSAVLDRLCIEYALAEAIQSVDWGKIGEGILDMPPRPLIGLAFSVPSANLIEPLLPSLLMGW